MRRPASWRVAFALPHPPLLCPVAITLLSVALAAPGAATASTIFGGTPRTVAGPQNDGNFGTGVAISANGTTAIVGSQWERREKGVARIYTRSGAGWKRQALIGAPATASTFARFGASVALSSDGDTALVAGYVAAPHFSAGQDEVAAWLFTRSGSAWNPRGTMLTAPVEYPYASDLAIALSGDGNTALLADDEAGAPCLSLSVACTRGPGAVYVFTRSAGAWTASPQSLLPDLSPNDTYAPSFGVSVALSGDGHTALVGANTEDREIGAAWAFTRDGDSFSTGTKIVARGERGAGFFGTSVALAGDGRSALIGAPNSGPDQHGAVFAYTRDSDTWSQQGAPLTDRHTASSFGSRLALSADGATAVIGSPVAGGLRGAVWFATQTATAWRLRGRQSIPGHPNGTPRLGRSVAISGDGRTALAGAPKARGGDGEVEIYRR